LNKWLYYYYFILIAAVEPVELTMALEAEKQEMPDFSLGGSNEDFEDDNEVKNDDDWDDEDEEETEEGTI